MKDVLGILFDLDGTLTNYENSAVTGLRYAYQILSDQGVGIDFDAFEHAYWMVIEDESPITSVSGIQSPAKTNRINRFRSVFTRLGIHTWDLLEMMADAYSKGRSEGARLYPDARKTLKHLVKSFTLGLLTEGDVETQSRQLQRYRIASYFQVIVISESTPFHKPATELFRLTADRMLLPPERIAMVGDRLDWDIKPAKKIGMKTIYINRSNSRVYGKANEVISDEIIDNLKDLLRIFNRT